MIRLGLRNSTKKERKKCDGEREKNVSRGEEVRKDTTFEHVDVRDGPPWLARDEILGP